MTGRSTDRDHVAGDPSRYRYARAARPDVSRPPDQAVELRLRSLTGVHEGPIPQSALDGVEGFWLYLSRPADFTPLARLRTLRWLAVQAPVDIDLGGLASALAATGSLHNLHIEAPVTDITPLAALTGLSELWLGHTRVTDLAPLAGLTRLHDLVVEDGPLADLAPLAGLRLSRLYVHRTRVADLSPLAGMATLQVLGLGGCPVQDLSVVATLPALHHVNLRNTPITDLGDLPARLPQVAFEGVGEPAGGADERARRQPDGGGRTQTADLLTEFRTTQDFSRQRELVPALVATRDREAVHEAVRYLAHDGLTLQGLFLQGGAGDVPFSPNPWNVPADAGLSQALTRVWRPIAELAPRFVEVLRARTLGLALLADHGGAPSLGYLLWGRNADRDASREQALLRAARAPITLDELGDRRGDAFLRVVVGTAPRVVDPAAVVPLLAGPIPVPVRDFWAVHHGLGSRLGGRIGGDLRYNTLGFFDGDGWDAVTERTGGHPPDRFVHDVGSGDYDSYVLDLDMLDPAGNPTVARWAWKEWVIGDHKQFWDWLDTDGTCLALL